MKKGKVKTGYLLLILLVLSGYSLIAQDSLNVLFLGNSYTAQNNLPLLTEELAKGTAKKINSSRNTPGGYTFARHSADTNSMNLIVQGGWNVVVLQEQSQIPTIPLYRDSSMLPAAKVLRDSILKYSPCSRIVLYMTWGRRFGGRQCDNASNCSPTFVDFNHMQDSLEKAYQNLADTIQAEVAPVGISWKNLLKDTNLVLHTADNSHPQLIGSYLAACTFHTLFWGESPDSSSYTSTLSDSLAYYLKNIADTTVLNHPEDWRLASSKVQADFSFRVYGDSVQFFNSSYSSLPLDYHWDFGDGDTSRLSQLSKVYDSSATYTVRLIASHCSYKDTFELPITISSLTVLSQHTTSAGVRLYPNPVKDYLWIEIPDSNPWMEVVIYGIESKKRYSYVLKNTQKIDLKFLTEGLYVIKLRYEGQEETVKLIKL